MTACFVPWPEAGTGGCPCGTYPDPCGSVGECLPQTQPPAVTCFPPAAACQKLGQCTTCEWIAPAVFQECGSGASGFLAVLAVAAGVAGAVVVKTHRDAHGTGGHSRRRR